VIEIFKISTIVFIFVQLGEPGMIFGWYQRLIGDLPDWLWRPLGGCVMCLTGQVLFHYYWNTHLNNYNIIDQLFYPAAGIFIVTIYDFIYAKLCQN
jgi:hypothetical protein